MRNRQMFDLGQRWAWVLVVLIGIALIGRLLFGP